MTSDRLKFITKIGVEQMGELADSMQNPNVLRLENLDTDIRPPQIAIDYTKQAIDQDHANSYLPFFGLDITRQAATKLVSNQSGQKYDWKTESLISAGGLSGIVNVLLATINPGDHVLMTDPTYVGLINRVRLAGGIPVFVPFIPDLSGWRLDVNHLQTIDKSAIKMALIMSPSMPTGATLNENEWDAICSFCVESDALLLYNAAMERILFDNRKVIHPASFEEMRYRTITVGAASKEYRMIGWRVGWVVGPADIIANTARVSISNVVCQTGIAMGAVAEAINATDDGISDFCKELQQRRDLLLQELKDFKVIPPHGGWSLFMDVSEFGIDSTTASKLLLEKGEIAATPMVNWGSERSNNYVRLVFSNEPLERLKGIGERVRRSF
jgi:aspartate/methionine/tyrosine aminotransferase